MVPTQSPGQSVPAALAPRVQRWRSVKLTTHLRTEQGLKCVELYLPSPHTQRHVTSATANSKYNSKEETPLQPRHNNVPSQSAAHSLPYKTQSEDQKCKCAGRNMQEAASSVQGIRTAFTDSFSTSLLSPTCRTGNPNRPPPPPKKNKNKGFIGWEICF